MKKIIVLIISILYISVLHASSPNLMLDSSSIRGLGLGGAFSAVEGDAETIAVNPAGLASVEKKEAAINYISWFEGSGFMNITGGLPLSKNIGTAAVNVSIFSVEDFLNFDENGAQLPDLSGSDYAVTLGMGRRFSILNVGANIKMVSTKLGDKSSTAFAFDIGTQTKLTLPVLIGEKHDNNLILGLSLQNLGSGQTFINESSGLPMKLRIGGNYRFYNKNKMNSSILLEFNQTAYQGFKTSVGLENEFFNIFTLRAGYKLINNGFGNFSVGFGAGCNLSGSRVGIDYVMIPTADFGMVNAIGLKVCF